jgi:hypothetical protein
MAGMATGTSSNEAATIRLVRAILLDEHRNGAFSHTILAARYR